LLDLSKFDSFYPVLAGLSFGHSDI